MYTHTHIHTKLSILDYILENDLLPYCMHTGASDINKWDRNVDTKNFKMCSVSQCILQNLSVIYLLTVASKLGVTSSVKRLIAHPLLCRNKIFDHSSKIYFNEETCMTFYIIGDGIMLLQRRLHRIFHGRTVEHLSLIHIY